MILIGNYYYIWKIIILCTVGLVIAKKATFDNYKVFKIVVTTQMQAERLKQLTDAVLDGFSFWRDPLVNKEVELMVAPHKLPEFYEVMAQIQASYDVYIENVQALINRATPRIASTTFDFRSYHTLDTIYKNLDDLAKQYPDKVQTIVGGKTYEGRPIKGVKVSFKPNNPGIFLEGGIHAREWISSATVMFILHELLTSNNPEVRELAESHDWYIFPLLNPDGFEYTHTANRLWRKTRKQYTDECYGSDPNRNWDYKWNVKGASNSSCSDHYAGSAPFSEIETKSMSQYIRSISDKFYAYIAFHNYAQYLMWPYGHTQVHLENYKDSYAIASKSIAALKKRYGTEYKIGNIAETFGEASGTSVDYVKGIYNKSIVFMYELRDQGHYGYLLPPEKIIPTGQETLDSLVAMLKEAKALGYPKTSLYQK